MQARGSFRPFAVDPTPSPGASLQAITSKGGETLRAGRLGFACGPWLPTLFPDVVGARIVAPRQHVFFAPPAGDARFGMVNLPAGVDAGSRDPHSGFPDIAARGFRIALDAHNPAFDPDRADHRITDRALAAVHAYLARHFPDLASRPLAEPRVCQYENSDNGDQPIDRHPSWGNVWLAGGGGGHDFKHGPAIGRYFGDLVPGAGAAEPRFALPSRRPHA